MDKNTEEQEKLIRRPPYLSLPPQIFKRGLKFPIQRTINSTIFCLLRINHAQGLMSVKNKSYLPSKHHPNVESPVNLTQIEATQGPYQCIAC